ncbi:Uracil-DNA glycosylase, putative [Babesia ovata]|uniref:Uracil-DNA glycosylase, putative n=1 Tax=Babesia ovata TaxID=189622 RepID=A0A2H6KFZ5_9APIC|nr:Uracil-DNA glycosylase, putative [Babesia ovata]GBE61923.1 Uracil-DNA glycosylase, putative [Babesia ovata]
MSAIIPHIADHSDTLFQPESFYLSEDDVPQEQSATRLNSLTTAHTDTPSDGANIMVRRRLNYPDDEEDDDPMRGFDDQLVKRKSVLLNALGRFKAKHPDKLSLPEYMMHAYVVLHTVNENTILTYEIIAAHTKMEPESFTKIMRSQTLSRLEQEDFDIEALGIFKADFDNDEELTQMDRQFTWLCECCCAVVDESDEDSVMEQIKKKRIEAIEANKQQPQPEQQKYENQNADTQFCATASFSQLVPIADLPNDVMYEALRQHGNRLVQRSLCTSNRRNYGASTWSHYQSDAAVLSASAAELRDFADDIQRYSVDNNTNDYYGEERRLSARQTALLRKRYL